MLHHYITKYEDLSDGHLYAVAWLQLDFFGFCWCFSERKKDLGIAEGCHKNGGNGA